MHACLLCHAQVPLPLPWRVLTTEEERLRGMTYYGSGQRLQRVASKLLAGRPIKLATLGGSVTLASFLHRQGRSYSALLFRFVNESFPHRQGCRGGLPGCLQPCSAVRAARADGHHADARQRLCAAWVKWLLPACMARRAARPAPTGPCSGHVLHNGGMPGSSSAFFAPCVERLVPSVSRRLAALLCCRPASKP